MVEKVGFTNCVFEKLCFPENTIFIVFSAKHSFSKTKTVCSKKQKIYEKQWVVFEHGGMVFFGGLFFEVLMFVFGVSGIVSKVSKMLVFPSFLGFFLGWLIVVHLGLEGLGVFVFLVFVFLFCLAFVSVLFALFLVLWLDVVVFFVCFFCFF